MSFGSRARFKWKGESCPDSEADSCWLDHGGLLVMDGQCQDEFLHCTDPGLEQERISVKFRWIKQHVASCSFLRTGVAFDTGNLGFVTDFFGLLDFFFVGYFGVPPAGHVFLALFSGCITFVTPGEIL